MPNLECGRWPKVSRGPCFPVAFAVLFCWPGKFPRVRPASTPSRNSAAERATIVADVKRQLQTGMGLLPLTLIRDRRQSFVALYSSDVTGSSSYGAAGYLGNGYFLGQAWRNCLGPGRCPISAGHRLHPIDDRRTTDQRARVDAGDARVEVDPGDWAILEVEENIDLQALDVG